jgi:hypothetical protein
MISSTWKQVGCVDVDSGETCVDRQIPLEHFKAFPKLTIADDAYF